MLFLSSILETFRSRSSPVKSVQSPVMEGVFEVPITVQSFSQTASVFTLPYELVRRSESGTRSRDLVAGRWR